MATLLLIHGMWGGSWHWENPRRLFEARGFTVRAPALRHHDIAPDADPDPALGTTSVLDYADDLETLIRALPEPPVLVGHSMGGLLAQILAARGLGRAAVLLMPAPPAGIPVLRPSVAWAFRCAYSKRGFWRRPIRQSFGEAAFSVLNRLPRDEQRAAHARFVPESGRAIAEIGLPFLDPHAATAVDATRVTCPVLAVGGGADRIVPATAVRRIAHKYRRTAVYVEYPANAHWVVAEPGWDRILGFVADWIERLPA